MKYYNFKRLYQIEHDSKYNDTEGHFWSDKLQQLKIQLSGQQSLLFKGIAQTEISVKVRYLIAEIIAKRLKPFAD
jgi:hypothetical protein